MDTKNLIESTANKYGFTGSFDYNLSGDVLFKSDDGTLSVSNRDGVDVHLSMSVQGFTLEFYSGYVNFNETTLNKAISDVLAKKKIMNRCIMAFVSDGWKVVKLAGRYVNDAVIVSKDRNKVNVHTNGSTVTLDGRRGKQTAVKVLHGAGVLQSAKQVPGSSGTYYANL